MFPKRYCVPRQYNELFFSITKNAVFCDTIKLQKHCVDIKYKTIINNRVSEKLKKKGRRKTDQHKRLNHPVLK